MLLRLDYVHSDARVGRRNIVGKLTCFLLHSLLYNIEKQQEKYRTPVGIPLAISHAMNLVGNNNETSNETKKKHSDMACFLQTHAMAKFYLISHQVTSYFFTV